MIVIVIIALAFLTRLVEASWRPRPVASDSQSRYTQ
jgi:hypothetical protein